MKLLMITDKLQPYTSANSAIAYQIAETLTSQYDVEVSFLGYQTGANLSSSKYRTWEISEAYRYLEYIPEGLPKWQKLVRLACHPELWGYRFGLSARYPRQKALKKALRRALREDPEIDTIMAVIAPYDTAIAAVDAIGERNFSVYKLDPWGTHISHKQESWNWEDEQRIDQRSQALFVTGPIFQDYVNGINKASLDKVHLVEFPNLRKPQKSVREIPRFEAGKIHCAYVGQLLAGFRSPDFLFELFRKMEDQNVILHVIGNTAYQEKEYQEKEYQEKLPSNVILHGIVSAEEAAGYMAAADVLVNLGNTIENQLPSKVISYLSYGKPILNLCKISNCLTIPYMKKYPLALTIMESEGFSPEMISKVTTFLQEKALCRIPFEEVEKLFPACTPEYVGRQVYEALLKMTQKKGAPNV